MIAINTMLVTFPEQQEQMDLPGQKTFPLARRCEYSMSVSWVAQYLPLCQGSLGILNWSTWYHVHLILYVPHILCILVQSLAQWSRCLVGHLARCRLPQEIALLPLTRTRSFRESASELDAFLVSQLGGLMHTLPSNSAVLRIFHKIKQLLRPFAIEWLRKKNLQKTYLAKWTKFSSWRSERTLRP